MSPTGAASPRHRTDAGTEAETDAVAAILDGWRRQRPDLDPSPMGVFGRTARVAAIHRGQLTEMLAAYDLTPPSFDVLANLRRSDPPHCKTPTELASSSMMSTGGMTFRVDKLESAGLVARQPSLEDRRVVRVHLTDRGKALIDEVIGVHLDRQAQILRSLSPVERDTLAGLLARVEAELLDHGP